MNEWMNYRKQCWDVNQYTNQVVVTTKTAVYTCVWVCVRAFLPCKSHSDTCTQSFPLLNLHFKQLPTHRAETNIYEEGNKGLRKKVKNRIPAKLFWCKQHCFDFQREITWGTSTEMSLFKALMAHRMLLKYIKKKWIHICVLLQSTWMHVTF